MFGVRNAVPQDLGIPSFGLVAGFVPLLRQRIPLPSLVILKYEIGPSPTVVNGLEIENGWDIQHPLLDGSTTMPSSRQGGRTHLP